MFVVLGNKGFSSFWATGRFLIWALIFCLVFFFLCVFTFFFLKSQIIDILKCEKFFVIFEKLDWLWYLQHILLDTVLPVDVLLFLFKNLFMVLKVIDYFVEICRRIRKWDEYGIFDRYDVDFYLDYLQNNFLVEEEKEPFESDNKKNLILSTKIDILQKSEKEVVMENKSSIWEAVPYYDEMLGITICDPEMGPALRMDLCDILDLIKYIIVWCLFLFLVVLDHVAKVLSCELSIKIFSFLAALGFCQFLYLIYILIWVIYLYFILVDISRYFWKKYYWIFLQYGFNLWFLVGYWPNIFWYLGKIDLNIDTTVCLTFTYSVISFLFVNLTIIIITVCMCYVVFFIKKSTHFFLFLLFILEIIVVLFFCVDQMWFFFFFLELSVIPVFFIISYWGSTRRISAASFYFIYTIIGSSILFFGLLLIYKFFGVWSLRELFIISTQFLFTFREHSVFFDLENNFIIFWINLIFFLIFFGICVKIPSFPFYIWLTEAHVEANVVGSVLLAGLMLKISVYVYIRICLPFIFLITDSIKLICCIILIFSIIITSLQMFHHLDLKRIIAFSSIIHMNICFIGLIVGNIYGLLGSLFYMFGHAFVASSLFLCIGFLYESLGSRNLLFYRGLCGINYWFAFFFFSFCLANIGFPCFCNFIGECLVLIGFFFYWPSCCIFLCFFLFFLSAFFFTILTKILFGQVGDVSRFLIFSKKLKYASGDFLFMIFFLFCCLFFGIHPMLILKLWVFWNIY